MKTRLIAILLILIAAAAIAQPAPRPGAVLAKYLDLTPDQVAAWKQIHSDTDAIVQPLVAAERATRTQIETALQAATPDPAAVGKLTITLHATRDQIRAARETSKDKLVAVLTPEQKVKFEAFEAAAKFARAARRH
jgi:Spy/CpxP family protein refolding chaperone